MRRMYLVYALSGFVALGYQVVWFRLVPTWFGSTSLSFALVVCNFIGGLGLGSLVSRPLTNAVARVSGFRDALRVYGIIELLIAAGAALTLIAGSLPAGLWGHFPYHLQDGIWIQNAGYRFGQLAVAVVCVFTPCFLMGTTFPLLSAAFVDVPSGSRFPAALYGWNTLGSCAGVLACQFLLLPSVGHTRTLILMIGINIAIAMWVLSTGRGRLPLASMPLRYDSTADQTRKTASNLLGMLLTCALLSGFVAGALEGDMFKRISLVVSSNPGALGPAISFWAILGIFLASVWVWQSTRLRLVHIKIAFVAAALYYYFAWRSMYPMLTARLTARYAPFNAGGSMINNFPDSVWELFVFVGACVFIPYLLISLLLPYVCNQAQGRRMHLGLAYGLNTVAFCVGLVAFTLLAPRVNIFYSLKLFWPAIGCGIGLLLVLSSERQVRWWQTLVPFAVLFGACFLTPAGFDPAYLLPNSLQSHYPASDLKSNGTDTTYVITVPNGEFLFFGNTSMSGTVIPSQIYMRLMAHFPLLLQKDPSDALVICFGVGNTTSAIATHSSIRHIDVVDLNRNVFETAFEFEGTNFGVYKDPRVRLINDDGRSFLHLSQNTYDLITSEPPPPMQAGVYRLYSREYYEDVLAHLTSGGMMTQWLPVYQMPPRAAQEAISTFVTVFPHALLYSGVGTELILLGSRQPIEIDRLAQQFPRSGREKADLAAIYVDTPARLAARIVRTDATLRRDYLHAPLISDERNDLEQTFLAAKPATVTYDSQEVLGWLQTEAPQMAESVALILKPP